LCTAFNVVDFYSLAFISTDLTYAMQLLRKFWTVHFWRPGLPLI